MKIIIINIIIQSKIIFSKLEEIINKAISILVVFFQFIQNYRKKLKILQINKKEIIVFTISIVNINKVLAIKKYINSKEKISIYFYK